MAISPCFTEGKNARQMLARAGRESRPWKNRAITGRAGPDRCPPAQPSSWRISSRTSASSSASLWRNFSIWRTAWITVV